MAFKRRGEPLTVEDEREALREQRHALEDLKRQLAERVEAVRERELELHHALAEAKSPLPESRRASRPTPLPPAPPVDSWEAADTGAKGLDAEREALVLRERALAEAEASIEERERELELHKRALAARAAKKVDAGADTGEDALIADRRDQALADREAAVATAEADLAERDRDLEQRTAAVAERENEAAAAVAAAAAVEEAVVLSSPEQDAARLAQIEARLAELRDAEKLFLRTREELADRSEAVAARERLVSQKERELDEREDGVGQWSNPELTEMEARLRRLEQGQTGEQTMGFSGGLRKLQQGTARPQREQ
jgi:hypothetical protein